MKFFKSIFKRPKQQNQSPPTEAEVEAYVEEMEELSAIKRILEQSIDEKGYTTIREIREGLERSK